MKLSVAEERTFEGASKYLSKQALVFRIGGVEPERFHSLHRVATQRFPALESEANFYHLVARSILEVQRRAPSDVWPCHSNVIEEDNHATIAVEYFYRRLGWSSVDFVLDWFSAVLDGSPFDHEDRHLQLRRLFRSFSPL